MLALLIFLFISTSRYFGPTCRFLTVNSSERKTRIDFSWPISCLLASHSLSLSRARALSGSLSLALCCDHPRPNNYCSATPYINNRPSSHIPPFVIVLLRRVVLELGVYAHAYVKGRFGFLHFYR